MKLFTANPSTGRGKRVGRRGFSILELMVAVALLGVVMFAMYSLFDQTQKALRAAVGQVDVNEPARAALDILSAELQRAATPGIPGVTNMVVRYFEDQTGATPAALPAWVESNGPRRRPFHEIYFLRQTRDRQWQPMGFFVGQEATEASGYRADSPWPPPVGSLYLYSDRDEVTARHQNLLTNPPPTGSTGNQFNGRSMSRFNSLEFRTTYSSRLLDGVVFFRVLPYDTYGRLLDEYSLTRLMGLGVTNGFYLPGVRVGPPANVSLAGLSGVTSVPATAISFLDEELPATLEIELGVLEPKTFEAYRSVKDAGIAAAMDFLERNQSRIQTFRRRVELRTAIRSSLP